MTKISIFGQNFNFWPKFQFLTKNSIFDQNFDFWSKFPFFTKISIFGQNFHFWLNFDFDQDFNFWPKFRFFNKKFYFWSKFIFLHIISIFAQNFSFFRKFYYLKNIWKLLFFLFPRIGWIFPFFRHVLCLSRVCLSPAQCLLAPPQFNPLNYNIKIAVSAEFRLNP